MPPSDILEKVENVEKGLQQRKRIGSLGFYVGLVVSAIQVVVYTLDSDWWCAIKSFDFKTLTPELWISISLLLVTVLSFLSWGWFKFWIKESKKPFRYTCSIGEFSPVSDSADISPLYKKFMEWVPKDIARLLNERIQRLYFVDENYESENSEVEKKLEGLPNRSHIHIGGEYIIRPREVRDQMENYEIIVMPKIKLGGLKQPSRLALTIYYNLDILEQEISNQEVEKYKRLLEQIYYSVATEIYNQIRKDVESKISYLGTRYLKGLAYYYEAKDYAKSNTFASYEKAGELYLKAIKELDPFNPFWKDIKYSKLNWVANYCLHATQYVKRSLKKPLSIISSKITNRYLTLANAHIGYSNMILFQYNLAAIHGRKNVNIYPTPRHAEEAQTALSTLLFRTEAKRKVLFKMHCTNALIAGCFGDSKLAESELYEAERLRPIESANDLLFLFGNSLTNESKIADPLGQLFELEPRFEAGIFRKAIEREYSWRQGQNPLSNVEEALMVIKLYQKCLDINPANIAALANIGYIYWLLDIKSRGINHIAKKFFEKAEKFKDVIPEIDLTDIQNGLIRIYAENGEFEKAYHCFVKAEDGRRIHQMSHSISYAPYYFEFIGRDLIDRFKRYKKNALSKRKESTKNSKEAISIVSSFVLKEYGEAFHHLYNRTGVKDYQIEAKRAYRESIELNGNYAEPFYYLSLLEDNNEERIRILENECLRIEPNWFDAKVELYKLTGDKLLTDFEESTKKETKKIEDLKEEINRIGKQEEQPRTAYTGFDAGDILSKDFESSVLKKNGNKKGKQLTVLENEQKIRLEKSLKKLEKERDANIEKNFEDDIKNFAAKIKEYLPHEWLKIEEEGYGVTQRLFRFLSASKIESIGLWEKEFNPNQALVFFVWNKIRRKRTKYYKSEERREIDSNLKIIRQKFYWNSFELLRLQLEYTSEPAKISKIQDSLKSIIGNWLHHDFAWWAATWIGNQDAAFNLDQRIELLEKNLNRNPEPAEIHRWYFNDYMKYADTRFNMIERPDFFDKKEENWLEKEAIKRYTDSHGEALTYYRKCLKIIKQLGLTGESKVRIRIAALQLMKGTIAAGINDLYSLKAEDLGKSSYAEDYLGYSKKEKFTRLQFRYCFEMKQDEAKDTNERRSYTYATRSLIDYSVEKAQTDDQGEAIGINVTTPIAIEFGDDIVDEYDLNDYFLSTWLPEMRSEFMSRYGVKVPGVRLRASRQKNSRYKILIMETLVAEGELEVMQNKSIEQQKSIVTRVFDRFKRQLTFWLAEMVRVQEVQNLLEEHILEYKNDIPGVETYEHIGPFTNLVRGLVEERTPINDFVLIYHFYKGYYPQLSIPEVIARIRMNPTIRPQLEGNNDSYKLYLLDKTIEDQFKKAMEKRNGIDVLILTKALKETIATNLQAIKKSKEHKFGLVVKDVALRPLMKKVIAISDMSIPVLARGEVLESAPVGHSIIHPTKKSE